MIIDPSLNKEQTPLFDLDEHALIRRTQQGGTEAFTAIVEKYQPRLYRHIHRRVKDTETAKDLTQEAWLKVLRAINSKARSKHTSAMPVCSSESYSCPTWKTDTCLGLHERLSFACFRDIRFLVSV